jgi:phosphopantetheinyl transferase
MHWTNVNWNDIQFTAREVAFIRDAPTDPPSLTVTRPQLKRFYRMWCLKESLVKALGVGIGYNLKSFEFDVQDEVEESMTVKNEHTFCKMYQV